MFIEKIKLAEHYDFLAGSESTLTAVIQDTYELSTGTGVRSISEPKAALLIAPGGGYHMVSREEGFPVALAFMPHGFNCFILDYTIHPDGHYPLSLLEFSASMDYIVKNAERFDINPHKIVVNGSSAGGHLAASYCTVRDREEITSKIDTPAPAAAILCYPVINAEPFSHKASPLNLYGVTEATPEIIQEFSLDRHVSKKLTPPTFIWSTFTDASVDVRNSLMYATALKEADVPFSLHIFPEGRHGLSIGNRMTVNDHEKPENKLLSKWVDMAVDWLKLIEII